MHRLPTFRKFRLGSLAALCLACCAAGALAENWARFRGEDGSGVSGEKGLPTTWSPGEYAFNVELPGEGHSAPVIWGDKLFVTSAEAEGLVRYLLCLNAATGETIWTRVVGMNKNHKHLKSSWASSTPATDGERVYVAFADSERYSISAYDFDGELLWRKLLGPFESQHGLGASPILFENLVIAVNDQDGPSSIVALDRATGQLVWSTLRPGASQATSYATPVVIQPDGHEPMLICSSSQAGVSGFDPRTGEELWTTGSLPARTVGSPVSGGGLIIQCCGGGGRGKELVAVDPTGRGDVSKTHIRYRREKMLPYVPTPIAYGEHLYLWTDDGIAMCVDLASGENVWTQRIGGNFTSSPICVDGKLYAVNEKGEVVVVAASPEYKLYGKSSLGDPSHATPSVANGRIYFRTFHRLACLQAAH